LGRELRGVTNGPTGTYVLLQRQNILYVFLANPCFARIPSLLGKQSPYGTFATPTFGDAKLLLRSGAISEKSEDGGCGK
jgi:hypothetical protein